MKKFLSATLALMLMLSTILNVTVLAASYPSISSSRYIEFTAQQNINVYKNTARTTRGTSSPSKKYNASISQNDTCYIYEISSSYIKVNYPTNSGRRTGYIRRSDLFNSTSPNDYISSAKAKVNVYKSTSGSYIAKGDEVWCVNPKKNYNGYCAVIYEAKSGNRAYKMGYITTGDLNNIKNEYVNTNDNYNGSNNYTKKLDNMINGTSYNGVYKIGIQYTGEYYTEQCKGFARSVHKKLFGYVVNSTQSKPKNYLLYSNANTKLVGSVTSMETGKVKNLFIQARPGDFVQIRRNHTGSHSAIVYSVNSNGITFYEANLDNKNTIYKKTYSWSDLCEKNAAMSLYTAQNY